MGMLLLAVPSVSIRVLQRNRTSRVCVCKYRETDRQTDRLELL